MTITDDELKAILDGCEGVTPGPWSAHEKGIHPNPYVCGPPTPYEYGEAEFVIAYLVGSSSTSAHTAHIARLDPDTVRAIVSELSTLRQSSPPDGQTAGDGLDKDEQMAIAEHLMMLADIDDEDAANPPCADLCGKRICQQLGCVVDKFRRTHGIPTPSSETKAPGEEH